MMSVDVTQTTWLSQHLTSSFLWLLFSKAVAHPRSAELDVLFLSDRFE